MTFLQTYLLFIPLCALFMVLVYVVEFSWNQNDAEKKQEAKMRILAGTRKVDSDTRPLLFRGNPPYPWKQKGWY